MQDGKLSRALQTLGRKSKRRSVIGREMATVVVARLDDDTMEGGPVWPIIPMISSCWPLESSIGVAQRWSDGAVDCVGMHVPQEDTALDVVRSIHGIKKQIFSSSRISTIGPRMNVGPVSTIVLVSSNEINCDLFQLHQMRVVECVRRPLSTIGWYAKVGLECIVVLEEHPSSHPSVRSWLAESCVSRPRGSPESGMGCRWQWRIVRIESSTWSRNSIDSRRVSYRGGCRVVERHAFVSSIARGSQTNLFTCLDQPTNDFDIGDDDAGKVVFKESHRLRESDTRRRRRWWMVWRRW